MASPTPEKEPLTERIEKVEKQNRWLVAAVLMALVLGAAALLIYTPRRDRIAMAALVAASAALLLGPARSIIWKELGLTRTLEAEKFVLRDGKGKQQAMLYLSDEGPSFCLSARKGLGAIDLHQRAESSSLTLWAPNAPRIYVTASIDGPDLALLGANGKYRASLALTDDEPDLTFYDANGEVRAALGLTDNEPSLTLSDANGKTRVRLDVWNNTPTLAFLDEEGATRAKLGLDVAGDSFISFLDAEGNPKGRA